MALSVRPLFDELLFCALVSARSCKSSKEPQSVLSGKTYFQPIEADRLPGRGRLYPRKGCGSSSKGNASRDQISKPGRSGGIPRVVMKRPRQSKTILS